MSLWTYELYDNNTKARLGMYNSYGGTIDGGYQGSIINGQIEGKIPQYIMPEGDTNYYPVTDISDLFYTNNELTIAPQIPSTVEKMYYTFSNCTRLQIAPEIPYGVTNMGCTFSYCTKLTGNLVLNMSNLTYYTDCLKDAATADDCNLIITGSASSTTKNNILNTKSEGSHISIQ